MRYADIIARLERTGPDRGLDGIIARDVLGWLPYFDLEGDRLLEWPQCGGHWHLPGDPCNGRHSISQERNPEPPTYTASIDAALTLVEGFQAYVDTGVGIGYAHACVWTDHPHRIQGGAREQATPAIALCIAALKARKATGFGERIGRKG